MEHQPASPGRNGIRWGRLLFKAIGGLVLLGALYLLVVLNWSYARGERAGYVQKFSKEGFLIKTWEGELAMVNLPGTAPEKFYFTVRDDAVAERINRAMGRRVALVYEEHLGLPGRFFGETGYFVVDVLDLEEPPTP